MYVEQMVSDVCSLSLIHAQPPMRSDLSRMSNCSSWFPRWEQYHRSYKMAAIVKGDITLPCTPAVLRRLLRYPFRRQIEKVLDCLKSMNNLKYIQIFRSYRAVNTFHHGLKIQHVNYI